jgi:hypothetical protein
MIGFVRAASICAMLALGLASAQAAEKAFRRDDLADSEIKLEAQIKGEAGTVNPSAATLRTDADAAFRRRKDFRASLQILGRTLALDVNGEAVKTALYRSYKVAEMANKPLKITKTGDAPVVVSASGPVVPEPAASNGLRSSATITPSTASRPT